MKIQDFTYLINNPSKINSLQTEELENVIDTFPYFHSARVLHLKGLKKQDSYKYNQSLKTTAAYTTDRTLLFNLIAENHLIESKTNISNNSELEDIEVIDAGIIKALHQKLTASTSEKKKDNPIEILEIGKHFNFNNNNNESHSFGEWLQLGSIKPIERKKRKTDKKSKFDLIDKFISSNPKIKPPKERETKTFHSEVPRTDYDNLMTETLAKVYLEQKKYVNAIKAYRILSLKYPEKSSFFATQIKAIKLLDKK
tara:strand:- start:2799 stop:3563 length:765 start_codon:yes stop_codon:yes gene_type:complete